MEFAFGRRRGQILRQLKWLRIAMAMLATVAALARPAAAQFTLGDTMRIIVPFAPGGAVDQVGRLVGNEVGKILGVNVIIENQGVGGGRVGTAMVANSPPDGKTILLATVGTQVMNPIMYGRERDVMGAFAPLAFVGASKNVLVVRKDLPARSLAELIALAKSGQRLTFGSAGVGTTLHLGGELINDAAGIKLVAVPYRGAGPALGDLVGGHVDIVVVSVSGALGYIQDGSVRPLATFERERAEQLPDLPTTVELGYPEMTFSNWFGFLAPAATPAPIRERLEKTFMAAIASPEVQTTMATTGVYGPRDAAGFKALLDADFIKWTAIIKRLGIKPE